MYAFILFEVDLNGLFQFIVSFFSQDTDTVILPMLFFQVIFLILAI